MSNELYHYGIKGQQWGRRLYQNKDGSLTAAGKIRYGQGGASRWTNSRWFTDDIKKQYHTIGLQQQRSIDDAQPRLGVYTSSKGDFSFRYNERTYGISATRVNIDPETEEVTEIGEPVELTRKEYNQLYGGKYADMSDALLEKLYKLTGDEKIKQYWKKRTRAIISAGKEYSEKSLAGKLAETVANTYNNSEFAETVNKGKEAFGALLKKIRKHIS